MKRKEEGIEKEQRPVPGDKSGGRERERADKSSRQKTERARKRKRLEVDKTCLL